MKPNRLVRLFIAVSLVLFSGWQIARAGIDPGLLAGMQARSIGPAGMSGRVADIDAVIANPDIIYVGTASGGVWKSENAGITWKPIFDRQPVASIGAVRVFQANPDIVWVGTGEANPRNSVSVGKGVYKSLDGGKTWQYLGLGETERIARIVLHPTDPDIAYVAALGKAWGENPQRGVYKTTDGGKTWRKILYVNERTGAANLVMDPANPNKLLAALWEYRRWPWFFRSGGPGSGLFLSIDGGETWRRLTAADGLPEGDLGRIGLAFSRSHPNIVYALVEAQKSALCRSEDGGYTWKIVNQETDVANRPFYYADIRVDPELPYRVYNLYSLISVSDDGGKTFRTLVPFKDIHPDHHAMWINPQDPTHIIIGNDGGVAISHDRGKTWRFVSNLPLAQFYHINVDLDTPYHIYGGMQDNGSWRGPAYVWENKGIRNHQWEEVGFGDGFDTAPDPQDSQQGYAMSQQGYLIHWNLRTGERKDIRPPAPDSVELRFSWSAGFAIDPFDSKTIYLGSQFVHRSRDKGLTWEIISPDLTTNNPAWQKQAQSGGLTPDVTGAENYTTITAIAPSPVKAGVIWVGTDDGRLHVTTDSGKTWTSVEKHVKGVPANTWIPHIEPSKFDPASAFVVFDDHRRSNWTPYVFKTSDYGKTWKSLVTDSLRGYCLVIEQDPVKEDLLFLGTEFGLYVSLNGGKEWFRWRHGIPTVAVRDLVVHPREHDLVVATHGRAAYILDDIRPLRQLSEQILQEPLHLFEIPPAIRYREKQTGASRFPGHTEFRGKNRPYGALITFSLNSPELPYPDQQVERRRREKFGTPADSAGKKPQVTIEVYDRDGNRIRRFKKPATLGVNRVVWNLRWDAFRRPPGEKVEPWRKPKGPLVPPGEYTVKIRYHDQQASGTVTVLPDPRFRISPEDRQAKWEAILHAGKLRETVAEAVTRIVNLRKDVKVVLQKARQARADSLSRSPAELATLKAVMQEGKALQKKLTALEKRLRLPPRTKGIVKREDALAKINYVLRSLQSSFDAPTAAQLIYLRQAEALLQNVLQDYNRFFAEEVPHFRTTVQNAGITLLPEFTPIELK